MQVSDAPPAQRVRSTKGLTSMTGHSSELETNGRREELLSGAPSMRNPPPDKDGTNMPESFE